MAMQFAAFTAVRVAASQALKRSASRGPSGGSVKPPIGLAVESNIDEIQRQLKRDREQVPFTIATALNLLAADVQQAETRRLPRVLDRPTPFTQRAYGISKASKRRLWAVLFAKRIQAGYLGLQETGGRRTPRGRAIVVPFNARLNKYGNLPRRALARALARPDTFIGQIRGVAGLWQRTRRGGVRLLVAFESSVRYEPRLGFRRTVPRYAARVWPRHVRRALEITRRTKR